MKRNKLFLVMIIGIIICGDVASGKKSRTRLSRPSSRTTPRPRTTTTHRNNHDVDPNRIGWAIPEANSRNKQNSGNLPPKPSAPLPDQNVAMKSNAPSLQSGYPGQSQQNSYHGQHQPVGQGYNPAVGQQYNHPFNTPAGATYQQPPSQSYNPSVGQPYHQTAGQPYNPSFGQNYHQPVGQPYNPSVGQPYHQPVGQPYNPPVGQTVILAPAQVPSSNRGLGQIAKEAVVFAGVSAGVNAAVNRLLPGGSRGGGTNTQITYNNYYNNQTDSQGNPVPPPTTGDSGSTAKPAEGSSSAPGNAMGLQVAGNPESKNVQTNPVPDAPLGVVPLNMNASGTDLGSSASLAPASGNPIAPPTQTNLVSNEELMRLSEELFEADANNAFKYITLKLQGQKTDDSITDSAMESLLTVQPEGLQIPTIALVRSVYNKYELDSGVPEKITPERRDGEMNVINEFLKTEVMSKAMKFIASKGLIPNDEYEFKDALKRIWFSQYARENNIISTSGFENVFLAEKFQMEITGLHNWIYFNEQESAGKANYLGYIREAKLGNNAVIIKLRATLNDIVRPVTTIFVGTSPELEMALYTICFFVRPNGACPVSLGSTPFTIFTNKISYFGKETLFSAYPEI
ncbi:endoribonuclease CG2145-like [Neodiprion virginianus]|uniref:endoribonuclease CG2145-like n=1 Tax=Neodiprion virginianus TaxID=2961670 RepID=UPI001EE6F4F3|nr:endoribonuclease CG2145-like [Neodiprion virginianus]